jgi:Icc-related predicted phosphoesterase
VKIVAISDTHALHRHLSIPDGDILVHAGDITRKGDLSELADFNQWLGSLPYQYKIVIAGNHDFCFEEQPEIARSTLSNCIYLQDEAITISGIKFYGSPWQPWYHDWAFNLKRKEELREKWERIPDDIKILVTHAPPYQIGDRLREGLPSNGGECVGCEELAIAVKKIKPMIHIFGHIHEGYGIIDTENTKFVNASSCNFAYQPLNPPLAIDLNLS